jgi:hypothetical protein
MRSRRSAVGLIVALVAVSLPVLVPVADAPLAATPAEAAPAGNSACTDTPQSDIPLLLPAWADTAGWYNADQYESIMLGDIDGDGVDELLGRNASNLEVNHWAAPYQASAVGNPGADAPLPLPGQWVPSKAIGPALAETAGFYDPSVYTTIQMANVDGDRAEEVIARATYSMQIYDFTPSASGGTWSTRGTGIWGDAYPTAAGQSAWWEPQYYETITHGDLNGDGVDELIGRGSAGIEAYQMTPGGYDTLLGSPSVMTDAETWNQPQYYQTIRVADVDGDGDDDVIGRGPQGMVVYSLSGGALVQVGGSGPWPNGEGQWSSNASWYSTIGTADLDGDTTPDVYGRTQYGIDAWTFAGGTWKELVSPAPSASSPSILTDSQSFDGAAYYSTIQPASLGVHTGTPKPAQLAARSPTGVAFYTLGAGGQFSGPSLPQAQFSDTNGWNQPVRYQTIHTGHLADGQDVLIGKDASGVRTYRLDGGVAGGAWAYPSAGFPAWSDWTSDPLVDPTRPPDYPVELWDAQLAAYQGINQAVGREFNTNQTVRQLLNAATGSNSVSLESLAVFIGNMAPPTGRNLTRDIWEATRNEVQGWVLAADWLYGFYFGDAANLQLLINQSFTVADSGPNSPSQVANSFSSNMAIDALVADLIWGIMGALPTGGADAAALTAIFSMTGAGVSAGMGFLNPNGSVDAEASNLNDKLVESFCYANAFLYTSFTQVVSDAGLLNAMGRLTNEGPLAFAPAAPPGSPPNPAQYSQVLATASNQRAIWVWQQFAAQKGHGWRVGYCWGEENCNDGFVDRVDDGYGEWYGIPPNWLEPMYGYYYRAISTDGDGTANCLGDSHGGDGGWKTLSDAGVGFDTNVLFWPRTQSSRMPPDPQMQNNAYQQPAPIDAVGAPGGSTLGLLGWRVLDANCNTF